MQAPKRTRDEDRPSNESSRTRRGLFLVCFFSMTFSMGSMGRLTFSLSKQMGGVDEYLDKRRHVGTTMDLPKAHRRTHLDYIKQERKATNKTVHLTAAEVAAKISRERRHRPQALQAVLERKANKPDKKNPTAKVRQQVQKKKEEKAKVQLPNRQQLSEPKEQPQVEVVQKVPDKAPRNDEIPPKRRGMGNAERYEKVNGKKQEQTNKVKTEPTTKQEETNQHRQAAREDQRVDPKGSGRPKTMEKEPTGKDRTNPPKQGDKAENGKNTFVVKSSETKAPKGGKQGKKSDSSTSVTIETNGPGDENRKANNTLGPIVLNTNLKPYESLLEHNL